MTRLAARRRRAIPGSQFIYLRDVRSGAVWSADLPADAAASRTTTWSTFRPEQRDVPPPRRRHRDAARDRGLDRGRRRGAAAARSPTTAIAPREIEVTSYAEIVLAPAGRRPRAPGVRQAVRRDRVPARERRAALPPPAARRARRAGALGRPRAEPRGPAAGAGRVGDRPRALPRPRPRPGRPAGARRPAAVGHDRRRARSDRQPAPAHPAARRAASCGCRFATGMATDRETALRAGAEVPRPERGARAPSRWRSRTRRAALRHLGISSDDALLFERLASRVLYADGSLRADAASCCARNELGQPACGRTRISGDLPILLVRVVEEDDLPLVRQVLQAQEYWRLKGLSADVVILNEHPVELPRRDARAAHGAARRRARGARGSIGRAAPTCCAATRMGERRAHRCSQPWRAPCSSGDRGELRAPARPAATPSAEPAAPSSRRRAADAGPPRRPARRSSVPAADARQRPRRLHRRRARATSIVLDGDQETPLPWVERDRQPALRHDRDARRARPTPGRRTAARTG